MASAAGVAVAPAECACDSTAVKSAVAATAGALGAGVGAAVADDGAVRRTPARGDPGGANGGLTASEARRLRKQLRKDERFEIGKARKREKKKERKKRRTEELEQRLEAMSPEERAAFLERRRVEVTQRRLDDQASLQRAFDSGMPKVVINCSFSGTMSPKEKRSLAKQAQMAYTAVRDLRSPIQLHLTSIGPDNPAHDAFEQIGAYAWTLHRHEQPVWSLFDAASLVVLTPDAEDDLEEVEADKIYVIGGIVDRTVCKRQSYEQAVQNGAICLRRLPIRAHGPYGANPILNINHVVHILAEWLHRGGDWPGVLEACLPLRRMTREDTKAVRRERNRRLGAAAADGGCGGEESDSSDDGSVSSDSDGGSEDAAEAPSCADAPAASAAVAEGARAPVEISSAPALTREDRPPESASSADPQR